MHITRMIVWAVCIIYSTLNTKRAIMTSPAETPAHGNRLRNLVSGRRKGRPGYNPLPKRKPADIHAPKSRAYLEFIRFDLRDTLKAVE